MASYIMKVMSQKISESFVRSFKLFKEPSKQNY